MPASKSLYDRKVERFEETFLEVPLKRNVYIKEESGL